MVEAVYCKRCNKLFPKDRTCRIEMKFSKYTEEFEDDFCEKCADYLEAAFYGD